MFPNSKRHIGPKTHWIILGSITLIEEPQLQSSFEDLPRLQVDSRTHQPSSLWDSHLGTIWFPCPVLPSCSLWTQTLPHVILQKWYLSVSFCRFSNFMGFHGGFILFFCQPRFLESHPGAIFDRSVGAVPTSPQSQVHNGRLLAVPSDDLLKLELYDIILQITTK